jgi:hypothetical protein
MMIFIFIASVSRWPPYVAGAGAAEHQIGPRGLDDEAGGDGFAQHPLPRDLGKPALRFRIAAANIAMHPRKPDLLDVLRAAGRARMPQVGPEASKADVNSPFPHVAKGQQRHYTLLTT